MKTRRFVTVNVHKDKEVPAAHIPPFAPRQRVVLLMTAAFRELMDGEKRIPGLTGIGGWW